MSSDTHRGTTRGADPGVVGPWLAGALGDDRWRDALVTLVAGGKSNLTYVVSSLAGDVVLRRPPLGHVLPTAHDMLREHRVITALAPTDVPVPRTLALCTDETVLGAPFYVMERVVGHVVRGDFPEGYADTAPARSAVADALVDVLVTLHRVDPHSVGLGDFGRPEGYLERQLTRWGRQWEATRVDNDGGLDALLSRLAGGVPASPAATIVHGDYRLDNVVLDPSEPVKVAAVLDWEMSTLGDPLADLGLWLVYWQEAGDDEERQSALVVPAATRLPGFPTRAEVAAAYAERSGRAIDALPWYVAFGFFKLAVVCAGVAARGRAGAMLGEGFVEAGSRIAPLTLLGHATLDGTRPL
jgi:aminoglycoside phosphotransferase (APT) family kinase protein